VAGARDNNNLERGCVRESSPRCARYGRYRWVARVATVPSAEGNISICKTSWSILRSLGGGTGHSPTSGDDQNRAGERIRTRGSAGDGEQLAHCYRLARQVRRPKNLGVELAGGEEVALQRRGVAGGDVSGRVHSQAGNRVGRDKVAAEHEVRAIRSVLGEAGQDQAGRELRVLLRQRVALYGAEAVADVHDLGVRRLQGGDGGGTELARELGQRGDLEEGLDLVDGLAVAGLARAEAIPGKGRVSASERGVDIAVLVVGEGKVPVAAVEGETVGEKLEDFAWARFRLAIGPGERICT